MTKIKPFFINSNIWLKEFEYHSVEDILTPIAGNTGNSYITYAIIKTLTGGLIDINHIQNIYTYDFSNQDKDIDIINNECTHVFLILQDQIRISESYGQKLPYEKIINFIKKLNKNVIIAGLGSNCFTGFDKEFYKKLNPELVVFLQKLSDYSEMIGIRGEFTQEVLSKLGIHNTMVIGCPSFFENGKNRIIKKKTFSTEFNFLQTSKNLTRNFNSFYTVLQDFQEKNIIAKLALEDYTTPLFFKDEAKIKEDKFAIFVDIESWKNFVSQFDFAFGYRLHGTILALNAGVPALCCNHDSRATEMCAFLKIPQFTHLDDRTNLEQYYEMTDMDTLNKAYPKLYENYKDFLKINGLKTFEENSEKYNYIQQPKLMLYSHKI
ncbi:MAG: polysaccharide pyruvyl transferase family protein [Clostridium sp.]|nr:polysaccharide pyruvyl transferase family protein [Clostridium sp.]